MFGFEVETLNSLSYWVYIGVMWWDILGYIGIMEKQMETNIWGLGQIM